MLSLRIVAGMFSVGAMVPAAGVVSAQDYPGKPIRIVTAQPGGGNDFAARLIAPGLSSSLGQQVIIENRGGAGGAIAAETVARAPPDGYTLLFYGSNIWLAPFLRDKVSWDPVRDFSPVTLAVTAPIIIVVHPSLPVKSVKELIALAKARPGELNYGSAGTGGPTHLAVELFKAMAGVNIVRVPYKGGAPAVVGLLVGEVQLTFSTPVAVKTHIKAGKLRALAVTTAQPSALLPGLPTVAASGLPGYESESRLGIFAPARTPATIISRLNQEIVRVLNQADVKEKMFDTGQEPAGGSPEKFAAMIRAEMATMGKVIKDAGIRAN